MDASLYGREFFDRQAEGSTRSAEIVVPEVIRLISPSSVIDIGCGIGTWLAAFHRHGIADVLGLDGSYVEANQLQIELSKFQSHDLTQPVQFSRRYSLVVSLEVAEHLPGDAANTFIDTLVSAAPTVVFSAAVPMQGGKHHLNEQPQSYWARLFAERGFAVLDCLRPRFWRDPEVEWWYRQNTFVYSKDSKLLSNVEMAPHRREPTDPMLDIVHPDCYLSNTREMRFRIDELHEVYKKRIRDAKAEVRRKMQAKDFGAKSHL